MFDWVRTGWSFIANNLIVVIALAAFLFGYYQGYDKGRGQTVKDRNQLLAFQNEAIVELFHKKTAEYEDIQNELLLKLQKSEEKERHHITIIKELENVKTKNKAWSDSTVPSSIADFLRTDSDKDSVSPAGSTKASHGTK